MTTPDPRTALVQAALPLVYGNPYIPVFPHPRQAVALMCPAYDMLYGGAAGGGKSSWVLMDALQWARVPRYSALILRKTYADLCGAGGLVERSHEWLANTDARWRGDFMRWEFPTEPKAMLSFGYLDGPNDHFRYQGLEFHRAYIDEGTQHRPNQVLYVRSRLRRLAEGAGSQVPTAFRATSNPGGVSHEWWRDRYMTNTLDEERQEHRIFLPARLDDNPSLDREDYARTLRGLDPITRRQLLDGDWTARHGGSLFRREWFEIVDAVSEADTPIRVRAWDLAASTGDTSKRTAGVRMARTKDGRFWVDHVVAGKWTAGDRDKVILQTAEADGRAVTVIVEQEPGSGGLAQAEAIIRLLRGYRCIAVKPSGDKCTRAGPVASAAQIGDVKIVQGAWDVAGFLDELEAVNPSEPEGRQYLDRMDALSSAFEALVTMRVPSWTPAEPPRRTLTDDEQDALDDERAGNRDWTDGLAAGQPGAWRMG